MSKKCFFSNRIYKNKYTLESTLLDSTKLDFNKILHSVYNLQILEKRMSKKDKKFKKTNYHEWLKEKFKLDDYYANSILQMSKAVISSQDELNKLYIEQTKIGIKEINKKISFTKTRITVLQKIKNDLKKGVVNFNNTGEFIIDLKDNSIVRNPNYLNRNKKKKLDLIVFKDKYTFEVEYLNPQLKRLKSRIGNLTFRLNRHNQKLKKLEDKTYVKAIVFGGKKLLQQYQREVSPNKKKKLLNEFRYKRNKQFSVSGRKDAGFGNFVFRYDHKNETLNIIDINKQNLSLEKVYFPYGQKEINKYFETQTNLTAQEKKSKQIFVPGIGKVNTSKAKPITFFVEDHKTYYIVKCMLEVDYDVTTNHSTSDGIIGIDCNLDHFALANIYKDGNLKGVKVINFDVFNKSSNKVTKIIEKAANEVVKYAYDNKKPICLEKLNTTLSKSGKKYNNKKNNLTINMFAYKKMLSAVKSKAEKLGIEVFEVNPAYTSIIGKYKYSKKYKISTHNAAAYVIGRRALKYKEKIPKEYKYIIKQYNDKIKLKFNDDKKKIKDKQLKTYISKWNEINKSMKSN